MNAMTDESPKPVMLMITFFPKMGLLDQFLDAQREGLRQMVGGMPPPGWRGNRLCRSLDGETLVMISMFESVAAHEEFTQRAEFAKHLERIGPLLERTEARFVEVVFEAGHV